jgi:hypothetical protein
MYSFLFNQTYISIFVIALLVFLIMFLWRKLTILEGNYFLLEKRVNIMKKEDRTGQLSKNLEKSDTVMKEVFKNNIKRDSCNINDTVCNIPKDIDVEEYIMEDIENNIDITIVNVEDANSSKGSVNVVEEIVEDEQKEEDIIDEKELVSHIEDITGKDKADKADEAIIEFTDINDNASTTSEITFNSEEDKSLSKKFKAMNMEKLREECKNNSLSSEGTKSTLIARIIDNIKKQK